MSATDSKALLIINHTADCSNRLNYCVPYFLLVSANLQTTAVLTDVHQNFLHKLSTRYFVL
jgi:hypothetical protein